MVGRVPSRFVPTRRHDFSSFSLARPGPIPHQTPPLPFPSDAEALARSSGGSARSPPPRTFVPRARAPSRTAHRRGAASFRPPGEAGGEPDAAPHGLGEMTRTSGANGSGQQGSGKLPRKRFYRARAHSNPLSDSHFPIPISPDDVDLSQHYPRYFPADKGEHGDGDGDAEAPRIRFADVGCGFGGLLVGLSPLFPDKLMIGMELRDKVTEYVKERVLALRASNPGQYDNISVVRTNSMKYIPNYFRKAQLSKMFFLFPDPHFKEKNHRRRVISMHLLDEYAYVMEVGGIIYTITDVEELGIWMRTCLEKHPLFEAVPEEEIKVDPVVKLLSSATEEGQKVARNGGQTFQAIFRRISVQEE